jgi:hypothetical protein
MRYLSFVFSVCLFLISTSTGAVVIKELEFNVDGVLPSADPDIELFNNSGQLESSVFSVSGGLLHQQTFGIVGSVSYFYPNISLTGDLNPNLSTTIEARLRIPDIDGRFGADISVFDGGHTYGIDVSPSGIHVNNWWGAPGFPATTVDFVEVDIHDFHTYRLDFDAVRETLDVSIDNAIVSSVSVPEGAFKGNGFEFGDGKTAIGNGANAQWDYIRVSQVPVPAALPLLATGLIGLIGITRKRKAAQSHQQRRPSV